jgi:hypothetical protein
MVPGAHVGRRETATGNALSNAALQASPRPVEGRPSCGGVFPQHEQQHARGRRRGMTRVMSGHDTPKGASPLFGHRSDTNTGCVQATWPFESRTFART